MQNIKKVYGISFSKYQILITSLFLATNLTYFTMAPRILLIFGFPQPGGILIFPFTFLLADIITEVYTYAYAKFITWCVLVSLGFFTLGTWLSMFVPAALDQGYTSIFANYPRLYLAISIATLVSFYVNNSIISKFKIKWGRESFCIRAIFAASVGHIMFSLIWVIAFHIGNVESIYLLKMIVCMYIWKMCFEIAGTPFAYWISSYLIRKEGFDAYDRSTVHYNPFYILKNG